MLSMISQLFYERKASILTETPDTCLN